MEGVVTDPSADLGLAAAPTLDASSTRALLEDIDAIVWTLADLDSGARVVSAGATRVLGYPASAWAEPGFWAAIVHPEDRAWLQRRQSDAIARGESHVLEYRVLTADGRERWLRDRTRVSRAVDGRLRVSGMMFDITGEKLAEQALREQRDLADAMLDASGMLVVLLDRSGVIQRANRACERLLGSAARTLVGRRFDERFADPEDHALARIVLQRAGDGRAPVCTEIRARRDDGVRSLVSWTFSALREEDGRLLRLVATGLDVTERAASEERLRERAAGLRHAQKMEAIGRLASGVSHEFNNLFTALLGFTQALQFEVGDDARVRPLTDGLHETLEHAISLTSQLRSMGRRDPEVLRPLELAAEVAARAPLLRRLVGEETAVELDLRGAGARVMGDAGQLQQLLLNLVLNARDAMPAGGGVRVAVRRIGPVDGAPARVELSVQDGGVGMDEATRARIFEPFFSTKGDSGSGLGLTAVYAIVQQWGGEVAVDSEPGHGTRMRLSWPEWSAELVVTEAASAPLVPRRPARVLLVEDEPRVRRLMLDALRRDGHVVLEAGDGREALELAEAGAEPFDLLVTDVVMPRLGGRPVAEALRARQPGLQVLFVSGYPDDAMIQRGVLPEGADFLQKPFPPDALVRRVRELLAPAVARSA